MAKKGSKKLYQMPEPLPFGQILIDRQKKSWRLGDSIGKGGFGEIYCAQDADAKGKTYNYAIKIEPSENGPLFVEMHFYMRNGKEEDVLEFCKNKKLQKIGLPMYYGSGSLERNGTKYRFLVMQKFDFDLGKMLAEGKGKLPSATVFQIGMQLLDVLNYIHSRGYVHQDIKAQNILLSKSSKNQAYLADFGLASSYKEAYKADPKKAHNGTIEYLSRDAHCGVESRRGDLEVLAYNLIHWLGGKLPWEKNLKDPKLVQQSKEENMKNIPKFIKACFNDTDVPDAIITFLKHVNTLDYEEEPNYEKLKEVLMSGLKAADGTYGADLQFTSKAVVSKRAKSPAKVPTPEKRARRFEAVNYSELPDEKNPKKASKRKNKENVNGTPKKDKKKAELNGHGEPITNAMKEVLVRKAEREKASKTKQNREVVSKPSTSKGRGKAHKVAKTHSEVVGNGYNSSSCEESPTANVTTRRRN